MYCKNCNNQLTDNPRYCPYCGQEQEAYRSDTSRDFAQDSFSQSSWDRSGDKRREDLANTILTWGVLSLSFTVLGVFSLLGFIFSFFAKSKAKEYIRLFGEIDGRARVGRDLGIAGFIVGLVMIVFQVLSALLFLIILFGFMMI